MTRVDAWETATPGTVPLAELPEREHTRSPRFNLVDFTDWRDDDAEAEPLWGESGGHVAMRRGEALMIVGATGVGKTTLAGQLVEALVGNDSGELLGMPVRPLDGPVLWLAMDRPRQIRRALLRRFRDVMPGRLIVQVGPLLEDVAETPTLLADIAHEARAALVVVDSLKDLLTSPSDERLAGGYNRARQLALAAGVELVELHHQRKAQSGEQRREASVASVYGSSVLTNGAGSVLLLDGETGDAIVTARWLKTTDGPLAPMRVLIDNDCGCITIEHRVDPLVELVRVGKLTARALALLVAESPNVSDSDVQRARRDLERLELAGLAGHVEEPSARGGRPQRVYSATDAGRQKVAAGAVSER